jgi:polysaccharide export outer membrane protein
MRRWVAWIALWGPWIAWADAPSETAIHASTAEPTAYVVGRGDVLEITVYGERELSRVVTVSGDGLVYLPLLGSVPVSGLSVQALATELDRRFVQGGFLVHPHTSVRVEEYHSQQIEVVGGVAKPGLYYLTGPTTLSQIIAQAGWIVDETASGQVTVRHLDGSQQVIDLIALMKTGQGNLAVAAGDRVSVGEGQVVFVNGQVTKPGKYPYRSGLTTLQALSMAADATPVARLSGAFVLRAGEKIRVNLKRVRRGRASDVVLEPGDTLFVPESPI